MKTVLIVEDEKMIRKGIKTMVQRSGVPVDVIIECNNGLMALEVVQNQDVDVVFTDIRMAKMDGIELVRQIQKLDNKPFIVAISGYDEFSYAVELMRMGVREYILKPVDRNNIKEILEKFNNEIKENREKTNEIRNIFDQQLKSLMVDNNFSAGEVEIMAKEYNYPLLNDKYVVCCIPRSDGKDYETNHYIFLRNVGNHDVILVSEENKNYLLMNELKGKNVGISRPYIGLEKLSIAYNEARSARKATFLTCKEYTIYEDQDGDLREEFDFNSMEKVAQKIGTDSYNKAIKQIEKLKYDTVRGEYSLKTLMTSLQILIDNIVKLYQNVLNIKEDTILKLRDYLSYPNIDIYFDDFNSWIIKISEEINTQFDDYKNKHKIHTALKYIQDNYNKDLNMAVVSNYISMNYSLFSYVFKQYTGYNFVNYLKNLRVNEAKRLLEETDLRVNEISGKVGYNNEKHFMKTFKNTCGVSPTEYRKNTRLKNKI